MLTENQIDKLIQPLLDRQQQIQDTILKHLAERIGEIKTILPSDLYKIERLVKTGTDLKEINNKIAVFTRQSEKDINKIITTVAKDIYKDAQPSYEYRGLDYIPFEQNVELQTAIQAIKEVTLEDYNNLSNSTAFMLRDPVNPLIVRQTSVAKAYQQVIDRAVQTAAAGIDTYNTLIPKTIKDLVSRGFTAVEYTTDTGKPHRVRLDSAVRRNILDGIRDVQIKTQEIVGEQFGADGVEISVHQYSAPDHEPIQGHQFTKEEYEKLQTGQIFKDVNGVQFGAIARPIGVWNCRHFPYSIIIGEATPNYTPEQLEEIKKRNADGIKIKDRQGETVQKSMYWCTLKQLDYELRIKKAKEGEAMSKIANETDLENEYKAKVTQLQNEYKAFCGQCGLKTRFDKIRIYI